MSGTTIQLAQQGLFPYDLRDGRISRHFTRKEFACSCGCGFDAVDAELVIILEFVRSHFERPVVLTGNRCAKHNASTPGSSPDSKHTKGMAADIDVFGVPADQVADFLEEQFHGKYGIGRYDTWTHIDTRPTMARWDNRTK